MTKEVVVDSAFIRALSARIEAALKPLGEELGVSLRVGKAKYSNASFGSIAVDVSAVGADGTAETRDARVYRELAHLYELDPNALGSRVMVFGKEYEIVGLKPRSSLFPVLARLVSSGKLFKLPADAVKSALSSKTSGKA